MTARSLRYCRWRLKVNLHCCCTMSIMPAINRYKECCASKHPSSTRCYRKNAESDKGALLDPATSTKRSRHFAIAPYPGLNLFAGPRSTFPGQNGGFIALAGPRSAFPSQMGSSSASPGLQRAFPGRVGSFPAPSGQRRAFQGLKIGSHGNRRGPELCSF